MQKIETLKDLEQWRKSILASAKPDQPTVTVCGGTGCLSNGSEGVASAIAAEMGKQKLDGKVVLKVTGCHGFCERG
ncbi:MAG TPA: (2Fe-2S) ferredoxin domain-containing protein, partial [Thermodesulfobacteriota bacterium]|nr:(2Fe-2S) ferredoxin domain-containing protein [Thermodesulfobacteriota bacterium]